MFVSSTFRDMHADRDYLSAHVFPRLEEQLRQRRHQLEPIDLRLGVETVDEETQEQRELLVLKVCLEEVQRSRPFLLVLLGDRYGTVLPQERMETAVREIGFQTDVRYKSVTALEIEYGILKDHPEQRARSFFYFREPLPQEQMTPEQAALYSDACSPDPEVRGNHERLLALKQAIRSNPDLAPRVHSYTAGWDAAAGQITGLEVFGEMVAEHLWRHWRRTPAPGPTTRLRPGISRSGRRCRSLWTSGDVTSPAAWPCWSSWTGWRGAAAAAGPPASPVLRERARAP